MLDHVEKGHNVEVAIGNIHFFKIPRDDLAHNLAAGRLRFVHTKLDAERLETGISCEFEENPSATAYIENTSASIAQPFEQLYPVAEILFLDIVFSGLKLGAHPHALSQQSPVIGTHFLRRVRKLLQNSKGQTYINVIEPTTLTPHQRAVEMLVLEGFQAGLSWLTILKKRDAFRKAFGRFDPRKIARYTRRDVNRLSKNKDIIRNRLKIEAAITNARAFLPVQKEFGSFDSYIWQFTGGKRLRRKNRASTWQDLPAESPESRAMSTALKRRGFRFVGPIICYAFMQAVGMVDDHLAACCRNRGA